LEAKLKDTLLACSGAETPEEVKEKKTLVADQKKIQVKITKKLDDIAVVRKE